MPDLSTNEVRFRERAELLDFLLEVSAAISETLDLDKLLANVAEIIRKVIPFELFSILLYSEKKQGLVIRYAIGHREEVVKNLVVPLGEGITGAAAATREPVLVGDVSQDPRYLKAVDAVRAELAVPMVNRGKLVGVIDIQATRVNAFTEYDRGLLRLIAARIAAAIENARLYRRAERQNRTLTLLARLSQEFSSILDLDDLLNKIANSVLALIHYDSFSLLLLDEQNKVLRHRFSIRYDQRVDLDNIPVGKGITGTAAQTREIIRVEDTHRDGRYLEFHRGIRSEIAVPLIARDRLIGVMDLESERVDYFTEDHARLLGLLAPQVASSVENARLYEELAARERRIEKDLEAARELQASLLPARTPVIEGLDIAVGLRPAREISGDLYDFFDDNGERAIMAFGDVSGKGVAAALYGALVGGLLRTLARPRAGPASLLRALNERLLERKVDARYVSLLVLEWQASLRRLTMANAGSGPPLVCRNGHILKLEVWGVPVGLLADTEYEESVFQAEPGDVVVLYSDGITDQQNPAGEEYGRRRLGCRIVAVCSEPARAIIDAIFADVDRFAETAPAFDDQTLLIFKVT